MGPVVHRSTYVGGHRQIEPLLLFAVPALKGILGAVTQLNNGSPDAFNGIDVQLDRSNPVFV